MCEPRLAPQESPKRNGTFMLVDVMIPAFNAADSIGRAVETALEQREVASVIVVDDCSTDGTANVVREVASGDPRLRLVQFERNQGPAAARNHALGLGDAPFVAMVDSDDWLLPGRFATLLAGQAGWDFMADNILFIPEQCKTMPLPDAMLAGLADKRRRLGLAEFIDRNISRPGRKRGELGFLKPVFRRELLELLDLRYAENVRLGEDFVLYAKAMARGARFILSQRCGYIAIERAGSLSGQHRTADLEALHEASLRIGDESGLSRAERSLLAAHAASIGRKAAHRRFLDQKRDSGLIGAISDLASTPRTLAHVCVDIIRDKRAVHSPPPAPQLRLLLDNADFP